MDGTLSQDEINALLEGMDTSGGADSGDSAPAGGGAMSSEIDESLLTDVEKDAVGEVANISMGSSATTLFSLVNQKVNITTPRVTLCNWDRLMADYERPCVFVQIKYTIGLDGSNIMILKEHDVMVITDLMMGGDGTNIQDGEIGELQLSAISEAMNQMMGAAATALSSMIDQKVDISPPQATLLAAMDTDPGEIAEFLRGTFVRITFKMQIGDLVDSSIMQLYPVDFAKSLYDTFITSTKEDQLPPPGEPAPAPAPSPAPAAPGPEAAAPSMDQSQMMGQPMMGQPMMGQPMMMQQPMMMPMQNMNVQPASFQNFSPDGQLIAGGENITLIKDVPLEVTVELGRTHKPISDILDFAPGTIIELDKVAGEPVDVLVNGKYVAKGEVVVIDESFGVRVTEIIK
ncbi:MULTISPECIES: flagellar motor switch phosphatase FliY [Butyrivibrio]|jgi:flagellar motor switch protein FliN/FliY|uniref:flagellar motor switch phosphatase FliY n=1 Tax=Butyrivibrio TaxID=830 RepID=UPI0003B6248B|nr:MULTISPECIES: flagellar motor switch phosphatase FliY [Butyrivibrio]SEP91816.1 flagellar motor switch protein FliN/FliY [Butyrivibrio sp. TB]